MRRAGYRAVCGDVASVIFNRKFDLIIGAEVIEHLPNPGLALCNLKAHLKDSGTLVITTCNPFYYRHTMAEVEKRGWDEVMKRALAEAREGGRKIYISFDVDVLDPAFMPGTGTPVPGGLTMREALPIVRRLCAENDLVGFELVELDPLLDGCYRSALNGNFVMHACLTGSAMRRQGIKDPGFLSELTTEHIQPGAGLQGAKDGKAEKVDPDYGTGRRTQH